MTLEEVYSILESKIYYEKQSMRKFSFVENSIHIDRRAFIPFSIYKENENFFLAPDTPIADEKELRIEIEDISADSIQLYGKTSGERLIILE
ncbi:MAG TPA: hypothetical protein VGQ09_00860 [Chitinophagaceae bacterium]|jgi:hypothetical protein|nr:hypothetical protein [Chitinophagaceae bacterium]